MLDKVAKTYWSILARGVRPTYRIMRSEGHIGTAAPYLQELELLGWLVRTNKLRSSAYRPHPDGFLMYGLLPPTFPGDPEKVPASLYAAQTYRLSEAFFRAHFYLPGPSDLALVTGHTRARQHQLLTELRRSGALLKED